MFFAFSKCGSWGSQWYMSWRETPVHVIDFEGSLVSGVVEFGVVTLLGGAIEVSETGLCAPVGELSFMDSKTHGLRELELKAFPTFSEYQDLFFSLRRSGAFCAHNAVAENSYLKRTWAHPGWVKDFSKENVDLAEWGPWLDTLQIYKSIYPQLSELGLEALVKQFSLQAELDDLAIKHCPAKRAKYHCALYDALASALLLLRLHREEDFYEIPLDWLFQLSQRSAKNVGQGELF